MKLPDIPLQAGLAIAGASCLVLVVGIKGGLLGAIALTGLVLLAAAAITLVVRHG